MIPTKDYVDQIRVFVTNARKWVAEHPGAHPKIQFNTPPGVMLIADIEDAITRHFVSVNDDGRALIAAMNEGVPENKRATAFMVQMAMEFLNKPNE